MARNDTAKGKVVRRLGVNIFGNNKYDRLLKKKPNAPGKKRSDQRKPGRKPRVSEYSKQLTEKQKLKFTYGLTETQMRNLFLRTKRQKGRTGDLILMSLESRMDNIVYQSGFASTRPQARQMVTHGNLLLNGKRVDIPSISLVPGDKISIRPGEGREKLVRDNLTNKARPLSQWLKRNDDELLIEMSVKPSVDSIALKPEMQLVVEYYSR